VVGGKEGERRGGPATRTKRALAKSREPVVGAPSRPSAGRCNKGMPTTPASPSKGRECSVTDSEEGPLAPEHVLSDDLYDEALSTARAIPRKLRLLRPDRRIARRPAGVAAQGPRNSQNVVLDEYAAMIQFASTQGTPAHAASVVRKCDNRRTRKGDWHPEPRYAADIANAHWSLSKPPELSYRLFARAIPEKQRS